MCEPDISSTALILRGRGWDGVLAVGKGLQYRLGHSGSPAADDNKDERETHYPAWRLRPVLVTSCLLSPSASNQPRIFSQLMTANRLII